MYGFVLINLVVHIFTNVVTGKMEVLFFSEKLVRISALHGVTYRRTVYVIRNFINFSVPTAHRKMLLKIPGWCSLLYAAK
jgi:hypothetical protein